MKSRTVFITGLLAVIGITLATMPRGHENDVDPPKISSEAKLEKEFVVPVIKPSSVPDGVNELEQEALILGFLRKGFGDSEVAFYDSDTNMFLLYPKSEEFKELVKQKGGPKWDAVVVDFVGLSNEIIDKMGHRCSLRVMDPLKEDGVLLNISNGQLTYDFSKTKS